MESIKELKAKLFHAQAQIDMERRQHINDFKRIIDNLIMKTPTGESRNELTDLNILFNMIIELEG